MGAFSVKFSIAPSGETKDRIKKVRRVQKWDGPFLLTHSQRLCSSAYGALQICFMIMIMIITMPSMVGIVGRAPAVDQKV